MRCRILSLIAAAALLAACETAPEEQAAQTGGGDTQPAVAAQPQAAPAAPMAQRVGPAMGSEGDFVVNVGDRVFFGYDKYNVADAAADTLKKQAAWLKTYGAATVTIQGHCDERGTREYNLALGERRANAVKDYLVALGVSPGRINVISYGKERPVALGSNEAAWAQNRRGVTKITGGAPSS